MSNVSGFPLNHSQTATNHASTGISVLTGFLGFSCVASVILNGLIVIVYFKDSSLRNSFNAYVANLSCAEVLLSVTGMPANFLRGLYGHWPLDFSSCTFFLYCNNIFGSGIRYGHVLITFNRLWAVTFPVHYRKYNRMPVTHGIIVATWVYLNVLHLPVVIPGRIWPKPNDTQCMVNTEFQKNAALTQEVLGFTLTEILMIVGSAFILYKLQTRKRVGTDSHAMSQMTHSVKTEETTVKGKGKLALP